MKKLPYKWEYCRGCSYGTFRNDTYIAVYNRADNRPNYYRVLYAAKTGQPYIRADKTTDVINDQE